MLRRRMLLSWPARLRPKAPGRGPGRPGRGHVAAAAITAATAIPLAPRSPHTRTQAPVGPERNRHVGTWVWLLRREFLDEFFRRRAGGGAGARAGSGIL